MTQLPAAPLDPNAVQRALEPLGAGRTLPAHAYTSAEVFEWEQRWLFEESWVCVARSQDLGASGDRRAVRVGSEGVLLVRDEEGRLRAFYNVCRHRGHELAELGSCRGGRAIRCPYHGWVYGLDGTLRAAARMNELEGFDRSEHSLVPAPVVEWRGWVFVNAGGHAAQFTEHAGNLDVLVASHEPERLVRGAGHDYVVNANWKIVVENYHECYHCPSIHPELCRVSPPDSGTNPEPVGSWVGGSMDLVDEAETMSLDGRSHALPLRSLSAAQRRQVFYYGLVPNLLISLHPDYVMSHRLEPLSPSQTRIECEWFFAPEAVEQGGFDASYAAEFWDVVNRQDWEACESVTRGAASRGYRPGPLSPREDAVHRFITMVARAYLGDGLGPPASSANGASPTTADGGHSSPR